MMPEKVINTGLVGFGLSGRVFHAPFIAVNSGFKLHTVVSSTSDAQKLYPGVNVIPGFRDMLEDPEIELVIIATPHDLHPEQAIAALNAGKHVVIEKPVALKSSDTDLISEVAGSNNLKVFPYHNRRWDGDFLTLKHLIDSARLGEILDYESRFDRFQPVVSRAEWRYQDPKAGGTLFDLGPHLIDQAICLFGQPEAVFCHLYFQRNGSKTNDSFELKLYFEKCTATLKAGVFVKEPGPRFQVHGTEGSYIKYGLDPQENRLKSGLLPDSADFGKEDEERYGILHSIAGGKDFNGKYPTRSGHYMGFYEDVYAVLNHGKTPEISIEDAKLNIRIMEAALESHSKRRVTEMVQ